MLKRVMSIFTGLLVLILFTSCSGKEADLEMRIAPSELSQETRDVLAAIGDETVFFDYQVDGTVQSVNFRVLVYEDGEWVYGGGAEDDVAADGIGRGGFRLREEGFDIITVTDSGYTRAALEIPLGFSDSMLIGTAKLTQARVIVPEEPLALFVKAGTEQNRLSVIEPEDYQSMDCDAGVAIEAVFSTERTD